MPRHRLRPGDAVFLPAELSRYGAYGSAGMPVFDRESGEELLLSAAHVVGGLARSWRDNAAVFTCTEQTPTPATQIPLGHTIDTIPSALVEECDCDAALVRVVDAIAINRRLDRGSIVRATRALTSDELGAIVHKRGCATGETRGEFWGVTDVPLRVRRSPAVYVLYSDVLSILSTDNAPFALPGDSGAILVDSQNAVVGLIVGMEDPEETPNPLTFAIPIATVLEALDVDL
jgi:hypothetical protein